jgi:hypothetical protein
VGIYLHGKKSALKSHPRRNPCLGIPCNSSDFKEFDLKFKEFEIERKTKVLTLGNPKN